MKPPELLGSAALARFFDGVAITCVDVGARGGILPALAPIAAFVDAVGFEPDAEECAKLNAAAQASSRPWRSLRYVPQALGRARETRQLRLLERRGSSSFLEPNVPLLKRFVRDHFVKIEKTVDVPTVPLADAARENGFLDAGFVKLDIQGAELEVLESGELLLDRSVVALHVEVEFLPHYVGQPLFHDVAGYVHRFGFETAEFVAIQSWRSATRMAPSLLAQDVIPSSHGWLADADVLFLVTVDAIRARGVDVEMRLARLALVALAYEQFDLFETIAEAPEMKARRAAMGASPRELLREHALRLAVRRRRAAWWRLVAEQRHDWKVRRRGWAWWRVVEHVARKMSGG